MQCLERLTASVQILELREVDCDWIGDLMGYFAVGHFDRVDFANAVNAEYEPDDSFEPHQAQHEFWAERPLEPDDLDCGDCTYFEKCAADIEGAIAVTYVEI